MRDQGDETTAQFTKAHACDLTATAICVRFKRGAVQGCLVESRIYELTTDCLQDVLPVFRHQKM
jgi:hypothetical protein